MIIASPGRRPLLVLRPVKTSTAEVDRTHAIAPVAARPVSVMPAHSARARRSEPRKTESNACRHCSSVVVRGSRQAGLRR